MEDEDYIDYLRKLRFIGLTSFNPRIEELLVPHESAAVEVNFMFNTNFTRVQLKAMLEPQLIRRRTVDEFYFEKTGLKAKKYKRR